ncbi:PaeR7I family type II restriction endonuclease [Streptomyces sp. GESEQ-35]|uniref:PaeR7I family type II restriction endonuclease n=1 Tax=Streptomyces sp. GESEQ-35 TaxID=2812657 RepID=UPI001B3415C0|nr:PaeR7I family type II restriction endonuclease [Streptomyces sp. GESEQ-35]
MSTQPNWDNDALNRAVHAMWAARSRGTQSGKHMASVEDLVIKFAKQACKNTPITFLRGEAATLPGVYRPRKNWDIVALDGDRLVFATEMKSQSVEKISNNANNRNEEAIGSATDLRLAHKRGLLGRDRGDDHKPWIGYFFILEEAPKSTRPARQQVSAALPTDPAYGTNPSYEERYRLLCQRLLENKLYDGACFLLSNTDPGTLIKQPDPGTGIDFSGFMASLGNYLAKYCANRT